MDGRRFRAIVGGKERGAVAASWRAFFRLLSIPYRFGIAGRDILYRAGWKKTRRLPRPTVSVGNLSLGGTGKTPMVAWLATFFRDNGQKPAFLSRGYGIRKGDALGKFQPAGSISVGQDSVETKSPILNDEARELAEFFPDVPHYQSPDRFRAGTALLADFPDRDIFILDDAFQHRAIARDWDIILLDALEPFGLGGIFPRGTLREPTSALRRADAILLSRADLVSPEKRAEIREKVRLLAPNAVWGEIVHRPTGLVQWGEAPPSITPSITPSPHNADRPLPPVAKPSDAEGFHRVPFPSDALRSGPFFPFCGLGNPTAFLRTAESLAPSLLEPIIFPDHHPYADVDFSHLTHLAIKRGAVGFLCSMKDLVKIRRPCLGAIPLFAIAVGIEFIAGEADFRERLTDLTGRGRPGRG